VRKGCAKRALRRGNFFLLGVVIGEDAEKKQTFVPNEEKNATDLDGLDLQPRLRSLERVMGSKGRRTLVIMGGALLFRRTCRC